MRPLSQSLGSARWRHEHRRGLRRLAAGATSLALLGGAGGVAAAAASATSGFGDAQVGTANQAGAILLATNQRILPIGSRILIRNGRLLSSSVSPDGHYLAALTWEDFTGFLTIFDLKTGKVVQQIGTGATKTDPTIGDGTVAADGPLWSADGKSLWFPQTSDLVRFTVGAGGTVSAPVVIPLLTNTVNLNSGTSTTPDLPSGMVLSPDGKKLYVALNGVNKLGIIDTATNKVIKYIKVGNAPRQVVLAHGQAFVSNEGGRPARPGQYTNQSDGTAIVANKVTGAASTGTVSVVNLATGRETKEINVGLQPTAEYLAPHGTLMVANSNDDSLSFIDTATGHVLQNVNVNPLPGSTVGSYPNSITMPDPHHLLVTIGRDNAVAVYGYSGPTRPARYLGLLPTDLYPVNAVYDQAIGKVVVTNDKGIGSRGPVSTIDKGPGTKPATGHNTYNDTGSLTEFAMPSMAQLGAYTHQVFVNNDWEHLLASKPISNSHAGPVAIPVHLGDPSKIKHVFVIVRENRTYDQVFGDIKKGNGAPALAQFGAKVTPNAHALANHYGLFDNFYDEGTLSADGHNWIVQADANDYIEREFGSFYRSYPAQGGDALAYQRNGFLWNAVAAVGKTARNFGEYNNFVTLPNPVPTWSQFYADSQILQGKAKGPLPVPLSAVHTYSDIPSLNAINDPQFPPFDLNIPDQYRTDVWLKSFRQSEKTGKLANLNMLWMPVDHTSGVGSGTPYPIAQVADNDLAVGRIISAISHSKFWKSSAIFVLEDDTQNGVDHVDGHRGPLLIASPYAARGIVDHTYYTQLNVVKTIEQILGVAPMNQEDRAAMPMFNAFTNKPNFAPYNYKPNQIPLTLGLTPAAGANQASAARAAHQLVSETPAQAGVPVAERAVYAAWVLWSRGQHFGGARPIADWANPQQLNRLDWYSAHGWKVPYPGDSKILVPSEVPGHNLPAGYLGD